MFSAPSNNKIRAQGAKTPGTLFQVSTIEALKDGCYDGRVDFARLAAHGDFGLGTLDKLDGEMVALDGEFYQATADGRVRMVPPGMATPFANVTFFKETHVFDAPAGLDYQGLQQLIRSKLPDPGLFYAIRIDGLFQEIRVVSAPPTKSHPYPKLDEMIKRRKKYDYTRLDGTLAGFWFPLFTSGINAPGYHMHFIDDCREKGGHVAGLFTPVCRVRLAALSRLELLLP